MTVKYFIDTSYLLALELANDQNHQAAQTYWKSFLTSLPTLVTTSYVLSETITYLNSRSYHARAKGGLSRHRLQRAIAYIQDHLAEDISLAEIAQEIDMSQHHFCRLFKQSTGIAPYQYVIQQRLERAKQLLLQNQLSIAKVAQEVGFSEQSQLTRQRKRATGLTPKQLRG